MLKNDSQILEYNFGEWLIFGPISAPLTICGLIGNGLTLQTLHQKGLSSMTSNIFLKTLTLADGALLLSYFVSFCIPMLVPSNVATWMEESGIYPVIYPIALTAQTIGVYTVVVFSIIRYVTISHPLRRNACRTRKKARILIGAIVSFSILFNVPRVFEYLSIPLKPANCSSISEHEGCSYEMRNLGSVHLYVSIYRSYAYTFGIFVVPVSIVAVLNARLAIILHRIRFRFGDGHIQHRGPSGGTPMTWPTVRKNMAASMHHSASGLDVTSGWDQASLEDVPIGSSEASGTNTVKDKSQCKNRSRSNPYYRPVIDRGIQYKRHRIQVTARLFCLVTVFTAFQTFPMIDNLLLHFCDDWVQSTFPNYNIFYALCQFSVMLNASVNTVLYCFLGRRFRREFLKVLHRQKKCIRAYLLLLRC
ncbi:unnamed protein product [Schistocephalus solidus]|uniref:G_PROTEIN_RECEP_F1_2 domain-containing protein n=1 Tax=Schistocephalus solidus TaxID=70667 RepID=A0A183SGN0_SCHSO|nr:unnamed protein product [Schistocephalus solidus]